MLKNSQAIIRDKAILIMDYGLKMTLKSLLEVQGIIHCNPEIMSGVPVFVGTRVPLQTFFDYLEGKGGLSEFINDFPYLETQTMKVLENAANQLH